MLMKDTIVINNNNNVIISSQLESAEKTILELCFKKISLVIKLLRHHLTFANTRSVWKVIRLGALCDLGNI